MNTDLFIDTLIDMDCRVEFTKGPDLSKEIRVVWYKNDLRHTYQVRLLPDLFFSAMFPEHAYGYALEQIIFNVKRQQEDGSNNDRN